ncbi:MAG: oligosaccharide flippase family protein [Solirubrobacteraceae bacterium]
MKGALGSKALREATLTGVRWLVMMRAASEVINFLAAVVLARLLSPADFGRAAVSLIFVMLGVMLTFEGFASALVQRPEVRDEDRRAAMLMSIVAGSLLTVAVYALAGPVWRPLFGTQAADLIQLISPAMLIAALGGVSRATIWRKLDFRRVSVIDMLSTLAGSIASVALAVAGFGAKSIAAGGLVQIGATTALLIACAPPPLPGWSRSSQRGITAFGIPAALAALVDTLFRNIDYAIIEARLPATQAGFYYRAFNIGVVYQQKLSQIMVQIAFPVYSRAGSLEAVRSLHERAARVLAAVIFPLLALLSALAPLIVPLVFGPIWKPAVVPTQILCVAGAVQAILTGYPQLMLAIGRPRSLLLFNVGALITYATSITLASSYGLVAVSITASAVYLALVAAVYRFLLQRHLGISIWCIVPELGPALVGCLAMVSVVVPLSHLLESFCPAALTVAVSGATGLVVYALVLRSWFRPAWNDVSTLVVRVLPPLGRVGRSRTATKPVPAP